MNRVVIALSGMVLAAGFCYGQSSSSAPAPAAIGHGVLFTKVDKTLDSSKLKEGDAVEVEMASGIKLPNGTVVPKGSKLMGHVVASKARSKGDSDSELNVVFDKLNVADGKQLAVKGMLQAVFPPADEVDPGVPGASTSHGGTVAATGEGGGASPGTVPTPDYRPMSDIKSGSNTSSNARADQSRNPEAVGVQGMGNLELKDGVLNSKGKNVKLGGGVRMIVHVDILG